MSTGLHINNILGVGTARHVHSLLQSPHDLDVVGTPYSSVFNVLSYKYWRVVDDCYDEIIFNNFSARL